MTMTDPIADFLTRIRNASLAKHEQVSIPYSDLKKRITSILVNEGYLEEFEVKSINNKRFLLIKLKYNSNNQPAITGLKRISKPGLRQYCKYQDLPYVLGGLGIGIISTSQGLLTDRQSRIKHVGGEVIAHVW